MLSRFRNEDGGFTLVELLVAIVLLGIVGGVTTTGLVQSFRTSERAQNRIQAFNELQIGMERITRELRAADPVVSAGGNEILLDVRRGGACIRHRFQYTSGAVRGGRSTTCSGAAIPMSSLIADVQNTAAQPVFSYLDERGVATTTVEDMAAIRITFVRAIANQPAVELTSIVNVRNYL